MRHSFVLTTHHLERLHLSLYLLGLIQLWAIANLPVPLNATVV